MSRVSKLSTFVQHTENGRMKYFNWRKWSLTVFISLNLIQCLHYSFGGGFLVLAVLVVVFFFFLLTSSLFLIYINLSHCIWGGSFSVFVKYYRLFLFHSSIIWMKLFSLLCNIMHFFPFLIWMNVCVVKRKGWAALQLPEWSC